MTATGVLNEDLDWTPPQLDGAGAQETYSEPADFEAGTQSRQLQQPDDSSNFDVNGSLQQPSFLGGPSTAAAASGQTDGNAATDVVDKVDFVESSMNWLEVGRPAPATVDELQLVSSQPVKRTDSLGGYNGAENFQPPSLANYTQHPEIPQQLRPHEEAASGMAGSRYAGLPYATASTTGVQIVPQAYGIASAGATIDGGVNSLQNQDGTITSAGNAVPAPVDYRATVEWGEAMIGAAKAWRDSSTHCQLGIDQDDYPTLKHQVYSEAVQLYRALTFTTNNFPTTHLRANLQTPWSDLQVNTLAAFKFEEMTTELGRTRIRVNILNLIAKIIELHEIGIANDQVVLPKKAAKRKKVAKKSDPNEVPLLSLRHPRREFDRVTCMVRLTKIKRMIVNNKLIAHDVVRGRLLLELAWNPELAAKVKETNFMSNFGRIEEPDKPKRKKTIQPVSDEDIATQDAAAGFDRLVQEVLGQHSSDNNAAVESTVTDSSFVGPASTPSGPTDPLPGPEAPDHASNSLSNGSDNYFDEINQLRRLRPQELDGEMQAAYARNQSRRVNQQQSIQSSHSEIQPRHTTAQPLHPTQGSYTPHSEPTFGHGLPQVRFRRSQPIPSTLGAVRSAQPRSTHQVMRSFSLIMAQQAMPRTTSTPATLEVSTVSQAVGTLESLNSRTPPRVR